jgi:hypothetical protein
MSDHPHASRAWLIAYQCLLSVLALMLVSVRDWFGSLAVILYLGLWLPVALAAVVLGFFGLDAAITDWHGKASRRRIWGLVASSVAPGLIVVGFFAIIAVTGEATRQRNDQIRAAVAEAESRFAQPVAIDEVIEDGDGRLLILPGGLGVRISLAGNRAEKKAMMATAFRLSRATLDLTIDDDAAWDESVQIRQLPDGRQIVILPAKVRAVHLPPYRDLTAPPPIVP